MRHAADFLRIRHICCEAVLFVCEDGRCVLWVWTMRKLLAKDPHVLLDRVPINPDVKLLHK